MKFAVFALTLLAALAAPVAAQKIDSGIGDRSRIVRLKTALNHLTVIEVAEPVVEVATGSPAFKVEWRDNKVFVQPTETDASTNLFIWTTTQRLNYELEPAASVTEMDFAIDQTPLHPPEPPKAAPAAAQPAPSMSDLLLVGKPVLRMQPARSRTQQPVEVWISDFYEKDGRVLIRYAVRNRSDQPYSVSTPQVYELNGFRHPQSLHRLENTQVGEEQIAKLKSKKQIPLQVVDAQAQPSQIAPGQQAVGVVSLMLPATTQPRVLRLQFPGVDQGSDSVSGDRPQIAAFVVR